MNGSGHLCARCECNLSFLADGQIFSIDGKLYCDICAERLRQAAAGPQVVCESCGRTVPKADTGMLSGRRLCMDCKNEERFGVRPVNPVGWELPDAETRLDPKNVVAEKRWEAFLSQAPRSASSEYDVRRRCVCFQRGDNPYEMERICIDLFSGTPYYSDESVISRGGAMDAYFSQRPLRWENFLAVAKAVSDDVYRHYQGIDGRNWRCYLKASVVEFWIPDLPEREEL